MEKMETHFTVNTSGGRLDSFLVLMLTGNSRSHIKRLIEAGLVIVDGKPQTKAGFDVSPGSSVVVLPEKPRIFHLEPHQIDFDIIAVHQDFLVINKPAGLTVHPAPSNPHEITLLHGLLHKFPEISGCGTADRPGIVHRLDKGTSGVMLIARNHVGMAELSRLFKDREIEKRYQALVMGHPLKSGVIDLPLGRHQVQRHKIACYGIGMRDAETRYQVVQYFENHTLLDVWPKTGRTHQIRVHLTHTGHPIVGDDLYNLKEERLVSRMMLHACQITFKYGGTLHQYVAPVPEKISTFVKGLKLAALE